MFVSGWIMCLFFVSLYENEESDGMSVDMTSIDIEVLRWRMLIET